MDFGIFLWTAREPHWCSTTLGAQTCLSGTYHWGRRWYAGIHRVIRIYAEYIGKDRGYIGRCRGYIAIHMSYNEYFHMITEDWFLLGIFTITVWGFA